MIYAYPTEGVWGLGCLPNSEEDVKKIFDAISSKLKSAEKRFSVALQSSKKNKFEL